MSVSYVSFSKLLEETMTHTPMRVGYWRIYKERLWRLCGSKSYKGRRSEILGRYKKYRNKKGKKMLMDLLTRDSFLLKALGEKDLEPMVFKMKRST